MTEENKENVNTLVRHMPQFMDDVTPMFIKELKEEVESLHYHFKDELIKLVSIIINPTLFAIMLSKLIVNNDRKICPMENDILEMDGITIKSLSGLKIILNPYLNKGQFYFDNGAGICPCIFEFLE